MKSPVVKHTKFNMGSINCKAFSSTKTLQDEEGKVNFFLILVENYICFGTVFTSESLSASASVSDFCLKCLNSKMNVTYLNIGTR